MRLDQIGFQLGTESVLVFTEFYRVFLGNKVFFFRETIGPGGAVRQGGHWGCADGGAEIVTLFFCFTDVRSPEYLEAVSFFFVLNYHQDNVFAMKFYSRLPSFPKRSRATL